jgi:hypothetical protein
MSYQTIGALLANRLAAIGLDADDSGEKAVLPAGMKRGMAMIRGAARVRNKTCEVVFLFKASLLQML